MKKKIYLLGFILFLLLGWSALKKVSKAYKNNDSILGRISNILNENTTFTLACQGLDKSKITVTISSTKFRIRAYQ